MEPYDDTLWRPIPADMPQEKLVRVLEPVFPGQPELVAYYATPATLNGLFCWTRYETAWQVTAFVRLRGLDTIADVRLSKVRQVARQLGRSKAIVQSHVGGNTGMPTQLNIAHQLLAPRHVPPSARFRNELRELGLAPTTWMPLARYGGIFTVDQLCACHDYDLLDIPRIGDGRIDEITSALRAVGRSLQTY